MSPMSDTSTESLFIGTDVTRDPAVDAAEYP
jgi:hypothetical protein